LETGETEYKPVVRTSYNTADKLAVITAGNGAIIESTPSHPFYDIHSGWMKAEDLTASNQVVDKESNIVPVISVEFLEKETTVYNFEVLEHHNYFVSALGLLVHNVCEHIQRTGNRKSLKPDTEYEANGYKYTTDSNGRISNAQGELVLETGTRNNYAQRTVGGTSRLPTDDGGHLIGTQFNGSGEIDNMLPQSSNVNRAGGEWYKMESEWVNALGGNPPSTVKVDITPNYSGSSLRPDSYSVNYWIDGELTSKLILNP